jgi:site-specific DNA-methyltransferase (cytosine-N4-specific)
MTANCDGKTEQLQLRQPCVERDYEIIEGDSRKVLAEYAPNVFQCCVTSPPYWGLRDYGVEGQIGAEFELKNYIADLVAIFREVRRTLRDDGTLWLNIGDSYTSGNRTWRAPDKKNQGRAMDYRPPTPDGLKSKDLVGVPWRLAFALQEDGWFLRSDIVWYKPNCQPESVKDRPTRSHEYVFLFSKSEDYYYNYEAVREPADGGGFRNRRSVWQINTKGFNGAHFAVFPPELVKLCILAGSQPASIVIDPFLGTGTVAQVSLEMDRKCMGIELKHEYIQMTQRRLQEAQRGLGI